MLTRRANAYSSSGTVV